MGHSKIMLASLALALFLIATPQPSHGVTINGQNIAQVKVVGTLYCSATGNQDPACGGLQCPPLSGALVTISCNGGSTTLGQVLTNTTGALDVVLSTLDGVLFDPSACAAYVKLPVASCAVLPPTGALRSVVSLLNIVSGATGGIATFVLGVFQVVSGI